MSNTSTLTRVTAGFLGLTVGLFLLAGIMATPAKAQTDLQAQIDALLATIAGLQAQIASLQGGGGGGTGYTFTLNLSQGDTGNEVMELQKALNADSATQVAASGVGSPGAETSYFGSLTKAAVVKFQEKHRAEVLDPLNLPAGTGFWGPSSRAKMNTLMAAVGDDDDDVVIDDDDDDYEGDLTVSGASMQPANDVAVSRAIAAARVPFTKIVVTAGPGGATIDTITVERGGRSANADVAGVIVMNEDGVQLGIQKSLNSENQAILTEDITVPPNSSRTLTIGANMPTSGAGAGNVIALSVVDVAVKGDGSVSGSFPITGAMHTVNVSLVIGQFTPTAISYAGGTKNIGVTNVALGGLKIEANSTEKIRLNSIRWNQIGSAGKDDLTNVVVIVDGTEYPTIMSSDGKYYTSVFGSGIVIDKGNSVEIRIKGDIESGSTRTVIFDIRRSTDINVTGETHGFGLTSATPASTAAVSATANQFSTTGNPWLDGATWTVGGGSIAVSPANTINAQNVAENTPDQIMGGYQVKVKGEEVTVGQMDFFFQNMHDNSGNGSDLTNVRLIRESDGKVMTSSADGTANSGNDRVRFTDDVVFPVGTDIYVLRGKYGSDFANNDTVRSSTTPSTDWSTVTGGVTGDTITPTPSSAVAANTMTVKAAALNIVVDTSPRVQTIVGGGVITFANYQFDTTGSGDAVEMTSVPLAYAGTGDPENLTNCFLYDGATALNDDTPVDPTEFSSSTTFTFDNTVEFPKQAVTTLELKCETRATTTATSYQWGVDSGATFSGNGASSNVSITPTATENAGQLITLATGGTLVVTDAETDGFDLVTPGTDHEFLRLRFRAEQEAVNIKQVALQLSDVASNSVNNLVGGMVSLYTDDDPVNAIATATFGNSGVNLDLATSTEIADGVLQAPSYKSVILSVRGIIGDVAVNGDMNRSGDVLNIDYDGHNVGVNGTYGIGAAGGTTVSPTTAGSPDTNTSGAHIVAALPSFEEIAYSPPTVSNGAGKILYKFKVEAVGGPISIGKFTFNVGSTSQTGATTSKFALYAYKNSSFSEEDDTAAGDGGLVNYGDCFNGSNNTGAGSSGKRGTTSAASVPTVEIYPDKNGNSTGTCNAATTTYNMATGEERWFLLKATISGVANGIGTGTFDVNLLGDTAAPVNSSTLMSKAGIPVTGTGGSNRIEPEGVDGDTNNDFIWAPNSTTTPGTINDLDFRNGFKVPGLPAAETPGVTHTTPTNT